VTDCNQDLLATARANVIETQNYAHRNAILRGDWDNFTLVKAEVERLLKQPVISEGNE